MSAWGAVAGALLAVGLVLVVSPVRSVARPARRADQAGDSPAVTVLVALLLACAAALVALATTGVPAVAVVAGAVAAVVPYARRRRRRVARARATRDAWPDAVDLLISSVRAGVSLPEALAGLADAGPAPLRPSFARFGQAYQRAGSLDVALDALSRDLADPIADRVVAAVRLAREFGGHTLGRVLRNLATMLREDARTRGEIQSRQSWTVAAARVAVAAPWVTLLLLCTRPESARAYATPAGALVVLTAAVLSAVAYAVMLRIGRLPEEGAAP